MNETESAVLRGIVERKRALQMYQWLGRSSPMIQQA